MTPELVANPVEMFSMQLRPLILSPSLPSTLIAVRREDSEAPLSAFWVTVITVMVIKLKHCFHESQSLNQHKPQFA